jgi:hypothetical protein
MASKASIEKADRIVEDHQGDLAALKAAVAQALDRAFRTGQEASLWYVEADVDSRFGSGAPRGPQHKQPGSRSPENTHKY